MNNKFLEIKFDTTGIEKVLDRLSKSVDKISKKALLQMGDTLLNLSSKEVPHDTGALQASGVVEEQGNDVIVGYHTPYAARLHEHPEYRFQKGRKGKYLEDPLKMNLPKWLEVYAREMEALFA